MSLPVPALPGLIHLFCSQLPLTPPRNYFRRPHNPPLPQALQDNWHHPRACNYLEPLLPCPSRLRRIFARPWPIPPAHTRRTRTIAAQARASYLQFLTACPKPSHQRGPLRLKSPAKAPQRRPPACSRSRGSSSTGSSTSLMYAQTDTKQPSQTRLLPPIRGPLPISRGMELVHLGRIAPLGSCQMDIRHLQALLVGIRYGLLPTWGTH